VLTAVARPVDRVAGGRWRRRGRSTLLLLPPRGFDDGEEGGFGVVAQERAELGEERRDHAFRDPPGSLGIAGIGDELRPLDRGAVAQLRAHVSGRGPRRGSTRLHALPVAVAAEYLLPRKSRVVMRQL